MVGENDLAKLADVKSWLGMKAEMIDFDADLQRSITACSLAMQRYMQRTIASTLYSHKADGNGSSYMVLLNAPIVSISSITVAGVAVPKTSIEFNRSTVFLTGSVFTRGRNNIALKYTAGFDDIPVDLVQACVETVGLRWRERDRIGKTSVAIQGETTAFDLADFNKQTVSLMQTYLRRVTL
jgi:hypothetical protein